MVIIEAIEAEQLARPGMTRDLLNPVLVNYNIKVIPNPTQAEIDKLVSSIVARRSGPKDIMALVAAEKHNGLLVTGDIKLLDDALAAKQYRSRFRLLEGAKEDFLKGIQRGQDMVVFLRTKGGVKQGPRKKWPADPAIPEPRNITGSPVPRTKKP
jgi:hypothetical protein